MGDFDRFKGLNFTPLDKYERQGKTLKGAFADLPNMVNRSWVNQALPELIWVALVRCSLDIHTFTDAFKILNDHLVKLKVTDISLTGISNLPGPTKQKVIEAIASSAFMRTALRPLLLFGDTLPDYNLWKMAIDMDVDYVEDAARLADTVARTLDHQTQESTDCRWFRVIPMITSNMLHLPYKMKVDILEYPNVVDMRRTRPSIRSMEISFDFKDGKEGVFSQWCDDFWTLSLEATQCLVPTPNLAENDYSKSDYEDFLDFHRTKLRGIRLANEGHLPNITLDVLTGAGFFALKILEELKDSPSSSGILGRLAARTLTELVVNLTYLTDKNDQQLWDNFYFHGQGEAKKIFLKYMRKQEKPAFIEVSDMWLIANETRFMDFLNINLGDWDDANLRSRAIEAGLKDFYDIYYDWPSNYTHATWAAIRREVYTPCQNPLHKFHLLPASEFPNDYGSVLAEALYLVKFITSNVYEIYKDFEYHKMLPECVRKKDQ